MASNSFITPGEITNLTFLADTPIHGVGPYGPYRAYKVQTDDGAEHTFIVPRYLTSDLDRVGVSRGTVVQLTASEARTRDNHAYTRIEIIGTAAPREVRPPQRAPRNDGAGAGDRILPCVALKTAAQTRGIAGEPGEVIAVAEKYLVWLRAA